MKITFTFFILLISHVIFAQVDKNLIFNNWVKTNIQFNDGEELSDQQELKFSYIRYSFEKPNKAFISFAFPEKGTNMTFNINNQFLELKNSYGIIVNSFLIEEITKDKLVLLQEGPDGYDDPNSFRYSFTSEKSYQKSIPITPKDILSITAADTIFISSEKIYAQYTGNSSLHEFLTVNIPEYKNVQATNNHFLASFIVRKSGKVDSLQILESINPAFDKQFVKAFNKSKKKWLPAEYNGRKVDVQMKEQFRFVSSDNFLPSYDYSKKGKEAMAAKQYSKALYYFEKALETTPDDIGLLFNKANSNILLGNINSACDDLQRIKASGSKVADSLIEKNCK